MANLSLVGYGRAAYTALDLAVAGSVAAGVTYVVAAGNATSNACLYTPAHALEAITVSATTVDDYRAWFSNFGSCVDVFAPGSRVISAYHTSDTATQTMDGTSMASPHVAGAAAAYLELDPRASPATVASVLLGFATTDIVRDPGPGFPDRLLHTYTCPYLGAAPFQTGISYNGGGGEVFLAILRDRPAG